MTEMVSGRMASWCVFVTGGAGFLGSKLVQELALHGANVIAVDKSYPQKKYEHVIGQPGYTLLPADLPADFDKLALEAEKSGCSRMAFIHMAGLSHVGQCERAPQLAFDLNVALTEKALRFCREHNVERFIFPSTGLIYGDTLPRSAVESDPAMAVNIYAATKIAAEAMIHGYCESFGSSATIVRLSNVYGAGGSQDTVVGSILSQIRSSSALLLRALAPVRDFIYADDVVEGLIRLLNTEGRSKYRVVNLSTGDGVSVRELAETACGIAGKTEIEIREAGDSQAGDSRLILDNSLLQELTGWRPGFDLQSGLYSIIKEIELHETVS